MADGHNTEQGGGTYGSAEAAEGWRRSAAARAQVLAPITERMLDLAGITLGNRVLDVAAGTGEQTLLAARRIGANGSVLATDIAARMLAGAAEAARQAGLGNNVETRVLDARRLDLEPASFDGAISRLALMLIPERNKALAGIHRALKPGKKFAALVMATAEKCPFIALPMAVAGRRAGTPLAPFEDPGLFALGDPTVLKATFEQAGFHDVAVEAVPVVRRFASLAVGMQNCRDVLPEVSQLMAHLSKAERDAAWTEIEESLHQFEGVDGLLVPQTYLIGVGTK
jgi:ubiquinone/menaquinone biosynthesis C-methylase UbiE